MAVGGRAPVERALRARFCARLHTRASETRAERAFHHSINAADAVAYARLVPPEMGSMDSS